MEPDKFWTCGNCGQKTEYGKDHICPAMSSDKSRVIINIPNPPEPLKEKLPPPPRGE